MSYTCLKPPALASLCFEASGKMFVVMTHGTWVLFLDGRLEVLRDVDMEGTSFECRVAGLGQLLGVEESEDGTNGLRGYRWRGTSKSRCGRGVSFTCFSCPHTKPEVPEPARGWEGSKGP